ncbi:MAG TPA: NAD-dependent succinate-semialdehyde dehydrogenase [Phenylobacterium sp.]|nr:NAD-dependent succinate-semialdehyde dehydrogenase [Phenylobacterium sp.]
MTAAPAYPALELFVAGEWIAATARETQAVINPATDQVLGALPMATPADLDRAVEAATAAFKTWRGVSALERGAVLKRAAGLIRARLDADAVTLTLEQGKPLAQARVELASSADWFDWYAEEARRSYGRVIPARLPGGRLEVIREPVGPVAAFAPWNFPASQMARKLAAGLAAGCPVIAKPSEETPGAALAIARALDEAGLPKGLLSVVFGVPSEVSAHLIAAPAVRKVSFTGSTAVGRLIAAQAAAGLKRATLELGGHAPVIVFDDVDAEAAARASATAKLRNAGQVCTSPTRFLVQEKIHDRFVEALAKAMAETKVGDGLDPATELGPLANPRRVEAMRRLTADAVATGGRLATGGQRIGNVGNFWAPTVIADAPLEAQAMNDEPFGPIALTRRFAEPEEALVEANRLPYGLAAYAFTRDRARAELVRHGIESGLVGLNTFSVTWPETPFGGVKDSGYGSEGGSEGLEAYLVTKLVSEV